jgi:hypothetical protein
MGKGEKREPIANNDHDAEKKGQALAQGGGESMKRRVVALLMVVGFTLATAMPALAAKPAPTKEECVATLVAIEHGEKLTGQQQQLVREFPTFQACIQASSG